MKRRSCQLRFLCMTVLGFLLCPSLSVAEYFRTGPVTGTVCKGFVVEFCSYKVPIVAVKEKGRFYPVAESFESVDEYRSNTCHIRLDRGGMWTPLNWVLGTLTKPNLYTLTDGEYTKIDPDSIRFPCVKQP